MIALLTGDGTTKLTNQNCSNMENVLVVECEVYSRVVGYYRPVAQYNCGKQKEFEQRKFAHFSWDRVMRKNKKIQVDYLGKQYEFNSLSEAHREIVKMDLPKGVATVRRWCNVCNSWKYIQIIKVGE